MYNRLFNKEVFNQPRTQQYAAATLNGSASVSVKGARKALGILAATGSATTAIIGRSKRNGIVNVSGTASTSTIPFLQKNGDINATSTAAVSVVAAKNVASSFNGSGTAGSNFNAVLLAPGKANLTSAASVSVKPASIFNGIIPVTGNTSVITTGLRKTWSSSALTGAATGGFNAIKTVSPTVNASGSATAAVKAVKNVFLDPTLNGNAIVAADSFLNIGGESTISGSGTLDAAPLKKQFSAAVLNGVANKTFVGVDKNIGKANITAVASLSVNPVRRQSGKPITKENTVTSFFSMFNSGQYNDGGTRNQEKETLIGEATVSASAQSMTVQTASISGGSGAAAKAVSSLTGKANIQSTGSTLFAQVGKFIGAADIQLGSSLSVNGSVAANGKPITKSKSVTSFFGQFNASMFNQGGTNEAERDFLIGVAEIFAKSTSATTAEASVMGSAGVSVRPFVYRFGKQASAASASLSVESAVSLVSKAAFTVQASALVNGSGIFNGIPVTKKSGTSSFGLFNDSLYNEQGVNPSEQDGFIGSGSLASVGNQIHNGAAAIIARATLATKGAKKAATASALNAVATAGLYVSPYVKLNAGWQIETNPAVIANGVPVTRTKGSSSFGLFNASLYNEQGFRFKEENGFIGNAEVFVTGSQTKSTPIRVTGRGTVAAIAWMTKGSGTSMLQESETKTEAAAKMIGASTVPANAAINQTVLVLRYNGSTLFIRSESGIEGNRLLFSDRFKWGREKLKPGRWTLEPYPDGDWEDKKPTGTDWIGDPASSGDWNKDQNRPDNWLQSVASTKNWKQNEGMTNRWNQQTDEVSKWEKVKT